MKFLLDANFLVYCVKQKVDIVSELSRFGKPELYVLQSVKGELEKIAKSNNQTGKSASIAINFVEKNVNKINSRKKPDDAMVYFSKYHIVCTNDKELIKRIKKKEGKVVSVRKKKILMML